MIVQMIGYDSEPFAVQNGDDLNKSINNISQMRLSTRYEGITVTDNKQYSCVHKVLCCKCFACCREEKVISSDLRKETMQRMVEDYLLNHQSEEYLFDPVKLMILIYICKDDKIPQKHLEKCKINPSTGVTNYRTDLQFYIPQLCNYIVFYRSLENNYLRDAIQNMCRLNYYFAHLYYFYMKSLEKNINKAEIQVIKPVMDYNIRFLEMMNKHYKDVKLTCIDLYTEEAINRHSLQIDSFTKNVILDYQTKKLDYGKLAKVSQKYRSIFGQEKTSMASFESSVAFFDDIFSICDELKKYQDKKEKVVEYVKIVNENLPSTAYIPFSKNCYRLCNVLKIVTEEVKVFSTKQRAPVCLCIETYCPAEELSQEEQDTFWVNVEVPITLKMSTFNQRSSYFSNNRKQTAEFRRLRQTSNKLKLLGATNILEEQRMYHTAQNLYQPRPEQNQAEAPEVQQQQTQKAMEELQQTQEVKVTQLQEKQETQQRNKRLLIEDNCAQMMEMSPRFPNAASIQVQRGSTVPEAQPKVIEDEHNSDRDRVSVISNQKTWQKLKKYNKNPQKILLQTFDKMFGEPLKATKQRIGKNSIFGNLKTWDVLFLIFKTHDDLKQEQFAMQLIQQFDYIFKLEGLPLILTTYEVLTMGADRGIIEMVKDAVTFDSLQKTLKTKFPTKLTLKQFFEVYFADNLVEAKQNFVKSLAAYSLVMYLIQAKDRHNGNILLHRSGKMFHIDFGFFLSNMPGGVLQFERDCPFKLLSEHVEVLDGINSHYFKKFREYFFLGFKAIKKHQNKVLMLVKLMYSTSGMTMSCFSKGEATISAMEARLNPKGATNDSLLNQHCQRLINLSLDNWAAKWYDRFQYWAQGIFY